MIKDQSRKGWFGASDARYILNDKQDTKTWREWWEIKCGLKENNFFGNQYTYAGNVYEHSLLKAISPTIRWDRQIKVTQHKLRVNYDGDINGVIYEMKTHRADREFSYEPKPNNQYWRQCQIQMFAWKYAYEHGIKAEDDSDVEEFKKLYIVNYPLRPDEYDVACSEQDIYEGNIPIDFGRLKFTEVKYDKGWVKSEFLPRIKRLAKRLNKEIVDEEVVEHIHG